MRNILIFTRFKHNLMQCTISVDFGYSPVSVYDLHRPWTWSSHLWYGRLVGQRKLGCAKGSLITYRLTILPCKRPHVDTQHPKSLPATYYRAILRVFRAWVLVETTTMTELICLAPGWSSGTQQMGRTIMRKQLIINSHLINSTLQSNV